MSDARLRPLREEDRPELGRIYREVRGEIGSSVDLGFDDDTAGERVLVAEDDGGLLGFVALWVPEDFVHHLYVDPRARGRGVGAALLQEALRDVQGRAWLKVDATNTAARAFYRRLGWEEEPPQAGVVIVRAPV
ncbi:MAG: GNAT family N-acetyltransferase [Planctomycetota bacterium]